jgi:[ribosomal protein S5]-alanine N-acetyltransferase
MIRVIGLTADQTHDLRRSVLRDGTVSDEVVFDGDDEPSTFHLGATVDDELVSISTWMARRYPDLPEHPGHQLRGMATASTVRGQGVGAAVLRAGLDRCAELGSRVVWARARVPAVIFYERHGFETRGPEYTDLTTGLAHRDIVVFVRRRSASDSRVPPLGS